MLTIEEALELVARHVEALAPRRVPLDEAAGLVLAEDVFSDIDSPPFTKSLMDGYAVISSDREIVRRVLEEVAAGAVPTCAVVLGTATQIMTGAPVPAGADAVVPVEKTETVDDGKSVRLLDLDLRPGQNVLPQGAAARRGDTVVPLGATLRPVEVAILAEVGHGQVLVHPRPGVAVLPTGNEVVSLEQRPEIGQIRNSNGPMLLASAAQAGADAIDCGVGRDDRGELRRRIEQGLAADILVLSGGVSAGKYDLVPEVLGALGVEQVFHKVSLRPGKPLWFGVKHSAGKRTLVFGLPGNPVSSFVCFELFVRPAIAALAGRGFVNLASTTARLSHEYEHAGGRATCLPARLRFSNDASVDNSRSPEQRARLAAFGTASVEILRWQGSADLAALAHANCLARLPADRISLKAGAPIKVHLI